MRILLDTSVLLWALGDRPRLGGEVLRMLGDRGNDVFFSAVSIWEIAIKASLGRADFGVLPEAIAAEAGGGGVSGTGADGGGGGGGGGVAASSPGPV